MTGPPHVTEGNLNLTVTQTEASFLRASQHPRSPSVSGPWPRSAGFSNINLLMTQSERKRSQELDCSQRAAGGSSVLQTASLTLRSPCLYWISYIICRFIALKCFIKVYFHICLNGSKWFMCAWEYVCVLISYLYTGLNILVLIHDWQDGLHAAVFHQVRLVPHKD